MPGDRSLLDIVNFVFLVAMSTAVHEAAHAWTADRFGDDTPRRAGRMTWNPLAHLDPMGSVVIPALMYTLTGMFVAWGSTPVTTANMRRPRLHGALCSAAGPASNFLLAGLALAAACALVIALGGTPPPDSGGPRQVFSVLLMTVWMNVLLGIFNLIPLPPLDGSHILREALPLRLAMRYASLSRYSFLILLVLFMTGLLALVLRPTMSFVLGGAMDVVAMAERIARG